MGKQFYDEPRPGDSLTSDVEQSNVEFRSGDRVRRRVQWRTGVYFRDQNTVFLVTRVINAGPAPLLRLDGAPLLRLDGIPGLWWASKFELVERREFHG